MSFCILPWKHLFLSTSGDVYPCCLSTEHGDPIQKNNGEVNLEFLSEAWNSSKMKEMRTMMLKGVWPSSCEACKKAEEDGALSLRETKNRLYGESEILNATHNTKEDGEVNHKITSFDLRLGNICNLKCRMCKGENSHLIALEESAKQTSNEKNLKIHKWHKNITLWEEIFNNYDTVDSLEFAGGEPFIEPELPKILKILIDRNVSRDISLSFHTNLEYLDPELLLLFDNFKSINIKISIDGFEGLNTYIRYPSKWSNLTKNIKILQEWKRYPFQILSTNTTIQAYNILNFTELMDFIIKLEKFKEPSFSYLSTPSYLSTQVLPRELRELSVAKIEEFIKKINQQDLPVYWGKNSKREFISSLEKISNNLINDPELDELDAFRKFTKEKDQIRGQAINSVCAPIAALF